MSNTKHFRNTGYIKGFVSHFFVALAAIASLVTLVSIFFEIKLDGYWAWIILGLVILICFGYACLQSMRKKNIEISIAPQFKVTIKKGNLFDEKGIIVIPVDQYFSTIVGNGGVYERSVHGQFITRFFKSDTRKDGLNNRIQGYLKDNNVAPINKDGKKNMNLERV